MGETREKDIKMCRNRKTIGKWCKKTGNKITNQIKLPDQDSLSEARSQVAALNTKSEQNLLKSSHCRALKAKTTWHLPGFESKTDLSNQLEVLW